MSCGFLFGSRHVDWDTGLATLSLAFLFLDSSGTLPRFKGITRERYILVNEID